MENKYSIEEKKLIDDAFKITRKSFEKDLDPTNDKDVVKAILTMESQFSQGTPQNKPLIVSIYVKNGLWEDGVTTLQEHDRRAFERKIAIEKRLNQLKEIKEVQIDEQVKALEQLKGKLRKIPESIRSVLEIDANNILKETETQLTQIVVQKENEVQKIIVEFLNAINLRCADILKQAKTRLENLKNAKLQALEVQVKNESDAINAKVKIVLETDLHKKEQELLKEELSKIDNELFYKAKPKEDLFKPETKMLKIEPISKDTSKTFEFKPGGTEINGEKQCPNCQKRFQISGGVYTKHVKSCQIKVES